MAEQVDQTAPTEEPTSRVEILLQGRMIFCPWCEDWYPLETYTHLQTAPGYEDRCPPILKHGGEAGCKKLFSLFVPVITLVHPESLAQNGQPHAAR